MLDIYSSEKTLKLKSAASTSKPKNDGSKNSVVTKARQSDSEMLHYSIPDLSNNLQIYVLTAINFIGTKELQRFIEGNRST